jgi:hypothetical protein
MSNTPQMMAQLQELTEANVKQRIKFDALAGASDWAKWVHQDASHRTNMANQFAKDAASEGESYETFIAPEPMSHEELLDLARKYYKYYTE